MDEATHDIPSISALARAVDRSRKTVSRWVGRDTWPFGRPPWSRDRVPEILRWSADALQPDRNDEAAGEARARRRYPVLDVETPAILALDHAGEIVAGALACPEPVVLPLERDILEGRRTLTPDEQRQLVLAVVLMKVGDFGGTRDVGPFRQAGGNAGAITSELSNRTHAACEVFREHIADIFGADAAGSDRPAWLGPVRGPLDEPLSAYLRRHDARLRKGKGEGGRKR